MSHVSIEPPILYWGTPVVLVATTNEDGSPNIGPMSSAFWLGSRCVLGLTSSSQTAINLRRSRQCTLNLPSDDMTSTIHALMGTTGADPVPPFKAAIGYRFVKDKFGVADLHPEPSEFVTPPLIRECPVQMEAEMMGEHVLMASRDDGMKDFALAIEVRVKKTMVLDTLRVPGHKNRIDPDKWRPMINSFRHLYGLNQDSGGSKLVGEEEDYRGLVVEKGTKS